MKCEVIRYKRVEGKDRIEDPCLNNEYQVEFKKHINLYLEKIRRCNAYWSILKETKKDRNMFINAYNMAPCFWNNILYSIQMGLVTDLVSFLSNDKENLKNYFNKILKHKDYIFSKKFYITWKNESTNEEFEEQWKNKKANGDIINECYSLLLKITNIVPKLKKARDKIYCHIDKETLDLDKYNIDILNKIKDEEIDNTLLNLGKIIQYLYAMYTNIQPAIKYENQDDVRNVIWTLDMYENNTDNILNILHNKK